MHGTGAAGLSGPKAWSRIREKERGTRTGADRCGKDRVVYRTNKSGKVDVKIKYFK